MGLYEELKNRKDKGERLCFDNITKVDLKRLFVYEYKSDSMIADLFEVKSSKVTYKRKKYGLTYENLYLEKLKSSDTKTNNYFKDKLLFIDNIDRISKAITYFAFRGGPVEDMHTNNQLSQEDMKTLNKFMVNRLAYVFQLIIEENWLELLFLINTNRSGSTWDKAIPDDGGNKESFKKEINPK